MTKDSTHLSKYRETAVLSSTPEQLVPVLYEGLVAALRRGAHQIRNKDIEGKCASIVRASDIIHELLGSLDFERGGALAPTLASLYAFWAREVTEAGRTLDAERLDALGPMVASLCEAWQTAARGAARVGG